MNIFQEGNYFFKKNIFLITIEIVIVSAFLIILNIFSSFNYNLDFFSNSARKNSKDTMLYSLVDNLQDPDSFATFIEKPENLQQIGTFYDKLNNHNILKYLAINDQPFSVADFKGTEIFEYAYGTEMRGNGKYQADIGNEKYNLFDVKSMQMNENAFDFYSLQTVNNSKVDWGKIDFESGKIPVILGSEYKNYYSVGDTITVYYLAKFFELEVKDFFVDNTFLFFKGNAQAYLDNYIVVPYPEKLNMKESSDIYYPQLYFEMINGDIVVNNTTSVETLTYYLNEISNISGFKQYSLLGFNRFVTEYSNMLLILNENRYLLFIILSVLFLTVVILSIFIIHCSFKRYTNVYQTLFLLGYPKKSLRQFTKFEIVSPIIFSNGIYIYFIFSTNILNKYSFIIGICVSIVICMLSYLFILKKTLVDYIN